MLPRLFLTQADIWLVVQHSGKITQLFHPDSARLFLSCFCLLKQQYTLAQSVTFHSQPVPL